VVHKRYEIMLLVFINMYRFECVDAGFPGILAVTCKKCSSKYGVGLAMARDYDFQEAFDRARVDLEQGRVFTARQRLRSIDRGFSRSESDCEGMMMIALAFRELLEEAESISVREGFRRRIKSLRGVLRNDNSR
jgi:hypothetical protein